MAEERIDTLKEQVQVVAEARERARKAEETKALIQVAFERQNRAILQETVDTANQVREAEAKLRELTLAVYAETGDKAPALGVGIREVTKFLYDIRVAFDWAVEHKMALRLDMSAFEKIAKVSAPSFVRVYQEPQATIAQDLNGLL